MSAGYTADDSVDPGTSRRRTFFRPGARKIKPDIAVSITVFNDGFEIEFHDNARNIHYLRSRIVAEGLPVKLAVAMGQTPERLCQFLDVPDIALFAGHSRQWHAAVRYHLVERRRANANGPRCLFPIDAEQWKGKSARRTFHGVSRHTSLSWPIS